MMSPDRVTLRSNRRWWLYATRAGAQGFLLTLTLLLSGCGEHKRNVVEIVTRGGATFIVVEPEANYERVCRDGEYSLKGDPDKEGLRTVSVGLENESRSPVSDNEIPWAAIDTIAFAGPAGDISKDLGGDFCPGQPVSIVATVHLKNGATQKNSLIDTTDLGIKGKSERGTIVIPIREIASLKMIGDQDWPWAKSDDHLVRNDELPTLRVTTTSGATREFWAPNTSITHDKHYGNYSLRPPDHTPTGFPALIAGARIAIAWNALKQVEIAGERIPPLGQDEVKLTAHIVYGDGHSEDAHVADGDFSTTANGGDSIAVRDIAHIELAPKPGTK